MPMGSSEAVNLVWNLDTTRALIPGFPHAPDILPHYHRQPWELKKIISQKTF